MSEQNPTTAANRPFGLTLAAGDLPPDALFLLTEGLRANGDVLDLPMPTGEGDETRRCVILGHPEDIQSVLKLNDGSLIKGRAYDSVRGILGDGVLTSDGQPWRDKNSIVRPPLCKPRVMQMIGTIASAGSQYVEGLWERTQGQGELVVDLKREMTDLTFTTITDVLFGEQHAQTVRGGLTYPDLQATFGAIAQIGDGLTEEEHNRMGGIAYKLTDLMHQVIPAARAEAPNGTMLSILAHATDRTTGEPLDDTTIRDELVTFLFAGHETAALTLTWMFEILQDHPEVAARMRHEIDTVLQGKELDATTLPQLEYTRRVIDEVMRCRPLAPLIAREATQQIILNERTTEDATEDGEPFSITIHPGDIVLASIWGAHHHPKFWTAPEEFNPDRFLSEADKPRIQTAYMPFADGSRSCTGQYLAPVEAVVHAALLMRAFDWHVLPEQEKVFPMAGITLQPSRPIRAHVTPRATSR